MKRLALLGSTGSIGKSTLHVARHLRERVDVVALAARSNIDLLEEQAHEFCPQLIGVYDEDKALELQKRLPGIEVIPGLEGLIAVATASEANFVVSAIAGTLGLVPTVAAIRAGKDVGLANKEALVSGGAVVMKLVDEYGINLIPIDSEHSAIFQCLKGENKGKVHRLILTSSGGPFRNYSLEKLQTITVEHALNHPTWKMGPKVTVDSSTLMNKGLEVIEAYWLFGLPIDQIEVVVHPQSIIHSMVEFQDQSILAQMSQPNMMTPIQYAITYPERFPGSLSYFDFSKAHSLEMFPPEKEKFRCLDLAYQSIQEGGSLPCFMNAANEVLVNRFLDRQISWLDIAGKLQRLMEGHKAQHIGSLEDVLAFDQQAREHAKMA